MTPTEAIASIRASIAAGYSPSLSDIEVLIAECGRVEAMERRLMLDNGFRSVFHIQRKGVMPEWENQTPGHSRKEEALACAKYCKQTPDRPLRVVEIRTRVVADPVAVDAAIALTTQSPRNENG